LDVLLLIGQINEPNKVQFKGVVQSTADHTDMQPNWCSSAVHVQLRKSKKDPKARIQAFCHHSELAPISVLYDIATINNRTSYNVWTVARRCIERDVGCGASPQDDQECVPYKD
jgi:hypothetical protein